MTCERSDVAAPSMIPVKKKKLWYRLSISGTISRINRAMRSKSVFSGNRTQENKALGHSVVNTDTNHVACDTQNNFKC